MIALQHTLATLATLPEDAHYQLAKYLPVESLIRVAATSAALRRVYHPWTFKTLYLSPPALPAPVASPDPQVGLECRRVSRHVLLFPAQYASWLRCDAVRTVYLWEDEATCDLRDPSGLLLLAALQRNFRSLRAVVLGPCTDVEAHYFRALAAAAQPAHDPKLDLEPFRIVFARRGVVPASVLQQHDGNERVLDAAPLFWFVQMGRSLLDFAGLERDVSFTALTSIDCDIDALSPAFVSILQALPALRRLTLTVAYYIYRHRDFVPVPEEFVVLAALPATGAFRCTLVLLNGVDLPREHAPARYMLDTQGPRIVCPVVTRIAIRSRADAAVIADYVSFPRLDGLEPHAACFWMRNVREQLHTRLTRLSVVAAALVPGGGEEDGNALMCESVPRALMEMEGLRSLSVDASQRCAGERGPRRCYDYTAFALLRRFSKDLAQLTPETLATALAVDREYTVTAAAAADRLLRYHDMTPASFSSLLQEQAQHHRVPCHVEPQVLAAELLLSTAAASLPRLATLTVTYPSSVPFSPALHRLCMRTAAVSTSEPLPLRKIIARMATHDMPEQPPTVHCAAGWPRYCALVHALPSVSYVWPEYACPGRPRVIGAVIDVGRRRVRAVDQATYEREYC